MDVSRHNLYNMLPYMLSLAQYSRFVAIDLEMTGITLNKPESGPSATSPQEAYIQAKKAAEMFSIIQIGLTFVVYDDKTSQYSTRTFNIPLSPELPSDNICQPHTVHALTQHLNRLVGFSMRSLKFLKDNNNLDLNDTFNNGCFYLGRHEEMKITQRVYSEQPSNPAIDISMLSTERCAFYNRAKSAIQGMLDRINRKKDEIIPIHDTHSDIMTDFHLRLVKQLINEKFPQCTIMPIARPLRQIEVRIPKKKIEAKPERAQEIGYLIGLRHLFESLAGGSFASAIRYEWTRSTLPGPDRYDAFNRSFEAFNCEASLRKNRPIIIGHNLFYDLVFIYRTFFGPLPNELDEFLREIHKLFPRIVDTKFMATRKHGGSTIVPPDPSLAMLYKACEERYQFPVFATRLGFGYSQLSSKENGSSQAKKGQEHLAGYDSEMTAKLFCRLGYHLFSSGKHILPTSEAIYRYRPLASSTQGGSGTILVGENHSPREIHFLPLWENSFWAIYGNKTRLGGAGVVSFV